MLSIPECPKYGPSMERTALVSVAKCLRTSYHSDVDQVEGRRPQSRILETAPLVAIEILSPEDRAAACKPALTTTSASAHHTFGSSTRRRGEPGCIGPTSWKKPRTGSRGSRIPPTHFRFVRSLRVWRNCGKVRPIRCATFPPAPPGSGSTNPRTTKGP